MDKGQKKVTLVWTDGTPETYMVPKLDVYVEGIQNPEELYPILKAGLALSERFIPNPHIHVHTEDEVKEPVVDGQ